MRKTLLALLLLATTAHGQLPPPPPLIPQPIPGEEAPFNPGQTREAQPKPPLELSLPKAPVDTPATPLSLFGAVELALRLQPDVMTARGQLRQSEGQVIQQRSALLPNIAGGISYVHTSSSGSGSDDGVDSATLVSAGTGGTVVSSGGRTTDRISSNIGLSQLLFDFGRTRSLVLQADLNRQAAAAGVLQTENDVTLDVKESFYGLILQRRLVQVRLDDLSNRQIQLRLARALYDAGQLAPGDVVRAQTAVTNTVVSLNTAQLNYELAKQDQAQSLGLSPLTPLEVLESSEPDLPDKTIAYLMEKAVERRPDMLVAQKNVEAGKAGLGAAYALNRPALTAFTGITYQGDINGRQIPTFTAQLQLDFSIYDGGQRAGAVTSAEGALQIVEADLKRTRLTVERDVSGSLAQLITAERNVAAAQAGVDSAREGVRIAQGRYQVALGTLTDVFDSQSNLVTAQTNLVNGLTDLDLARARLRYSVASPFEEGYPVNVDGVPSMEIAPVLRSGEPLLDPTATAR